MREMDEPKARKLLLKWEQEQSTVLVRLETVEASSILFTKIRALLDDRVILDVIDQGTFRVSLIGIFEDYEAVPNSVRVRYASGACIFISLSGNKDEWPDIISEFE